MLSAAPHPHPNTLTLTPVRSLDHRGVGVRAEAHYRLVDGARKSSTHPTLIFVRAKALDSHRKSGLKPTEAGGGPGYSQI